MITVTRKNYWGKRDSIIDEFESIERLYDYYKLVRGRYGLESLFSHNPFELYKRNFTFHRTGEQSYFYDTHWCEPPEYCMVVYNENNIRLSRETLLGIFRKFDKKHYCRMWRGMPGHKRNYRGHSYRPIRTYQERRESNNVLAEEGEPVWRARRNWVNLPNVFDDVPHLDQNDRCWKRFRKTRWK